MKNFYCPDIYNGIDIYESYMYLKTVAPEIFIDNFNIKAVFGAFPFMSWNGGTVLGGGIDLNIATNIIKRYEKINIPIHLTLSNPLLKKEDCYDRWCNKILELCYNEQNKIIISSPYLEEYIRKNFPKYKFIKSIITTEKNENYLEMLDTYDMIVLPRRVLKDFDFLNSIPIEKRNKFEILCNDPCPINCPFLYEHYKNYGKVSLFEESGNASLLECKTLKNTIFPHLKYQEDQILPNQLNKYEDLFFTEFKISGRGSRKDVIFSTVPYLIKNEYQFEILKFLL